MCNKVSGPFWSSPEVWGEKAEKEETSVNCFPWEELFVIHENTGSTRGTLGKLYCRSGQMNCFSPALDKNGCCQSSVFDDPVPRYGLSSSAEEEENSVLDLVSVRGLDWVGGLVQYFNNGHAWKKLNQLLVR